MSDRTDARDRDKDRVLETLGANTSAQMLTVKPRQQEAFTRQFSVSDHDTAVYDSKKRLSLTQNEDAIVVGRTLESERQLTDVLEELAVSTKRCGEKVEMLEKELAAVQPQSFRGTALDPRLSEMTSQLASNREGHVTVIQPKATLDKEGRIPHCFQNDDLKLLTAWPLSVHPMEQNHLAMFDAIEAAKCTILECLAQLDAKTDLQFQDQAVLLHEMEHERTHRTNLIAKETLSANIKATVVIEEFIDKEPCSVPFFDRKTKQVITGKDDNLRNPVCILNRKKKYLLRARIRHKYRPEMEGHRVQSIKVRIDDGEALELGIHHCKSSTSEREVVAVLDLEAHISPKCHCPSPSLGSPDEKYARLETAVMIKSEGATCQALRCDPLYCQLVAENNPLIFRRAFRAAEERWKHLPQWTRSGGRATAKVTKTVCPVITAALAGDPSVALQIAKCFKRLFTINCAPAELPPEVYPIISCSRS